MRAGSSPSTTPWPRARPGIWALGDCNGRGAFTHTAYNDFEIVAANLLDGASRRVSERIPAYALYIDPPLGRVGMTETAARASGRPLLVGNRPMTRVGRAVEKGETQGFMKVVADAATRQILGAAILGVGGDEAIHGVVDMMNVACHARRLHSRRPHPSHGLGADPNGLGGHETRVIGRVILPVAWSAEQTETSWRCRRMRPWRW